jgi:exopolysaccharide biosynthesis protein
MAWSNLSTEYALPVGVEVFAGEDDTAPLKAWMARIDASRPRVDIQIFSSAEEDGRESVSDMVQGSGACLGVNGGYFLQTESSFQHIGLLIAGGKFERSAIPGVYANDNRYPVRRSALGLDEDDTARIGWVSSRHDSSFWWDAPLANLPDHPFQGEAKEDSLRLEEAYWGATDAVAAGPMIVRDGQTDLAIDQEVFFHTTIPDVHPRTAAGVDAEGRLLLLVVDGRQSASRGVSLEELAGLMLEFGAVDALNLDGGGSSTFIIGDELLNRPSGATYQREVVSGIVVHCG